MKLDPRAVAILLIAVLSCVVASAQRQSVAAERSCTTPSLRTDIRPGANGPPTEVSVGIRLIDLLEINDVSQTITVDLAIIRAWTDPRLAHLEGCELPVDAVWFPDMLLRNSGQLSEKWPRQVSIDRDGKVTYIQRISGAVATYHNLRDFPFDKQRIVIKIIPLKWSEEELKFSINNKFTGIADHLNISDWKIDGVEAEIGRLYIHAFDKHHSAFDFIIKASRIQGYYVWKIILPLSLIVFMSWCVFWISEEKFGPQIGLSATSMLTLIAFIFATTNMVPKLGHFTLLDLFIGGSLIIVFLALLESLVTTYLVSRERTDVAMRVDQISRIVFPLLFAALVAALFTPVIWR